MASLSGTAAASASQVLSRNREVKSNGASFAQYRGLKPEGISRLASARTKQTRLISISGISLFVAF